MNITLGESSQVVAPAGDGARHAKLVDAAQQFEGMLLQEMLKGIERSKDEEAGDSGGGSSDTLQSFGIESVAHAIAKGGGVGIARQVVEKVTAERAASSQR